MMEVTLHWNRFRMQLSLHKLMILSWPFLMDMRQLLVIEEHCSLVDRDSELP
ncbi:hypothetical protein ES703_110024 [subsurface metagenome]